MPSISERAHIRWGTDSAKEDTSTLVLTSTERRFVDIRVFIALTAEEPLFPNTGGPLNRLDWAFAGTSHSSPLRNQHGEMIGVEASWEHWVDSKYPIGAEIPVDKGDVIPQPNSNIELEYGAMVNPKTNIMTRYEEAWRDLYCLSLRPDGLKFCVVLCVSHEDKGVRGMIVRVAQYCQGILKVGDELSIERWQFTPQLKPSEAPSSDNTRPEAQSDVEARPSIEDGDWTRQIKIGSRFLPCAATFQDDDISLGGTVKHGDFEWHVVEKQVWSDAD